MKRLQKNICLVICSIMIIGLVSRCSARTAVSACEMQGMPVVAERDMKVMFSMNLSEERITYEELQNCMLQDVLENYQSYADANPDYVGWIYLADTKVDGPVVQSQLDGDGYWEYLYKDFYGNDKFAGTLFMDKACSIEEPVTDNWMIYGHNMNDGSMFGTLKNYKEQEFWESHPTFTFVTRDSIETFEILGVVQSWVSEEPEGQFEYFFFFDAKNEEEFRSFVQQVKENSLYDTGVEAKYGDQLITLSTCDSWHTEGRLAVIGRKQSE